MNKSQLEAIRARFDEAILGFGSKTGSFPHSATSAILKSIKDIPPLLEVLEAETKRADYLQMQLNNEIAKFDRLERDMGAAICYAEQNVIADRDQWKSRAQALERAIRYDCQYCVNCWFKESGTVPISDNCNTCKEMGGISWQFDQTRFTVAQNE
jgi:hypothetical protein